MTKNNYLFKTLIYGLIWKLFLVSPLVHGNLNGLCPYCAVHCIVFTKCIPNVVHKCKTSYIFVQNSHLVLLEPCIFSSYDFEHTEDTMTGPLSVVSAHYSSQFQ